MEPTRAPGPPGISRRGLLTAAGLGAAAVATGGLGVRPALAAVTKAAVPASQRFDISKESHDLWRNKSLHQKTVMQSFTFDNVNKRLFVAQVRDRSGANAAGDLCVTQLDFAGNEVGHMFLNGFGHAVSIGVEPSGSASILWLETGPIITVGDPPSARGTRLGRVPFTDGLDLDWTSPRVEKHAPITGVDCVTCATDPVNNRLAMRYRTSDKTFRVALYDLADVRSGVYTKLADIAPPGSGTFQGYTIFGEYLYMLDGDAYDDKTNPPPGNAHVSCVSFNGGDPIRVPTNAGGSLTYREPEGMAVYRTDAGEPRLFLGFASGDGPRFANLFYKNVLI